MRKKILLSLLAVCCTVFSFGQTFQVTTGTERPEEKWAMVEDRNLNAYVTIGNANENGQSKLWIASYAPNGTILTSATAHDFRNMIARDISIAPYDDQYRNTYYVTGWTDVSGFNQMFVGRINLNGVFLWLQINPFVDYAQEMEGVAIATEPITNDAVALGITKFGLQPGGPQITLSRFNPAGGLIWSNVYAADDEWMPREICIGPQEDDAALPGNFVITGEQRKYPDAFPKTFAARYNGGGAELWRAVYPAALDIHNYGDAGYDVVWEPRTKNYCVVGVVQTDPQRASVNSTPYILNIAPTGVLVASTVYFFPGQRPMGMYPRCVAIGRNPGQVVFAGPSYYNNRTFYGTIPSIAPPAGGLFEDFNGAATANSVPQPFILTDAWPEDITLASLTNPAGYMISTTAVPGVYGNNDGHLILVDLAGKAPNDCAEKVYEHEWKESLKYEFRDHIPYHLPEWKHVERKNDPYHVEQKFCQDNPCDVQAGFIYSVNCKTVSFTNTSVGTGPFTYNWSFGDATSSALANPVHTYAACGLYTVRLIVCSPVCCDTIIQTVNVPCCSVSADFCVTTFGRDVTLNYSTANPPVTNYTVYLDGAIAAPVWNNNTTRTLSAGVHTICVKATRIACGDTCCATVCKSILVNDTCTLAGDFAYQVFPSGNVNFTDLSSPLGGNTYAWNFGDGGTSVLQNPSHAYSAPGTYTVCLKVRRLNGSDTCEQYVCKTVVIDQPCKVKASFKSTHCVTSPLTVKFTNMSSGSVSYLWEFGTGATSNVANPTYTYPAPGTYIVCLKALQSNNCWYRVCYKMIVSTATFSNNCNGLPPNPLFRVVPDENVVVEQELISEESSASGLMKAAQPKQVEEPGKLNLFPNPASQQVQAVFMMNSTATAEVTVVSASGSQVYKTTAPSVAGKNQLTIPVAKLPSGVYLVRIKTGDKVISNHFFVDNR